MDSLFDLQSPSSWSLSDLSRDIAVSSNGTVRCLTGSTTLLYDGRHWVRFWPNIIKERSIESVISVTMWDLQNRRSRNKKTFQRRTDTPGSRHYSTNHSSRRSETFRDIPRLCRSGRKRRDSTESCDFSTVRDNVHRHVASPHPLTLRRARTVNTPDPRHTTRYRRYIDIVII